MKNRGFTLAETLITLVIIGVVAALTVPNMIIRHQKEETVTRLKKAYSTLAQSVLAAKKDYSTDIYEFYSIADFNAYNYYYKFFKPYLITKNCNSTAEKCGYTTNTPWKLLHGGTYAFHIGGDSRSYVFYLSDGTFIALDLLGTVTGYTDYLPRIYIDINGAKKPNMFGRDVFVAFLDNKKGIIPDCNNSNISGVNYNCSKKQVVPGNCCFKKILNDNWKIADDYPW